MGCPVPCRKLSALPVGWASLFEIGLGGVAVGRPPAPTCPCIVASRTAVTRVSGTDADQRPRRVYDARRPSYGVPPVRIPLVRPVHAAER
eukprot:4656289-Pleurochrysis_carterae.AAC.1